MTDRHKEGKMKKDLYIKVILTIIAICLIWICIRDVSIGEKSLHAANFDPDQNSVYVAGISKRVKSAIEDATKSAIRESQPFLIKRD
jgi:hypothetical protein